MTKQAEIDAITAFCARLPEDSYLKPWLREVLPFIETDIRNDVCVSPTLAETRRQCDALLRATAEQADTLRRQAVAKGEAEAQRLRAEAAALTQTAVAYLERWENRFGEHLRLAVEALPGNSYAIGGLRSLHDSLAPQ